MIKLTKGPSHNEKPAPVQKCLQQKNCIQTLARHTNFYAIKLGKAQKVAFKFAPSLLLASPRSRSYQPTALAKLKKHRATLKHKGELRRWIDSLLFA